MTIPPPLLVGEWEIGLNAKGRNGQVLNLLGMATPKQSYLCLTEAISLFYTFSHGGLWLKKTPIGSGVTPKQNDSHMDCIQKRNDKKDS